MSNVRVKNEFLENLDDFDANQKYAKGLSKCNVPCIPEGYAAGLIYILVFVAPTAGVGTYSENQMIDIHIGGGTQHRPVGEGDTDAECI